MNSWGY